MILLFLHKNSTAPLLLSRSLLLKPAMESQKNPLPIITIFFIASLVPCCLSAAPTDSITSCLTLHDIYNFTTYTDGENDDQSTDNYYKLLNFSIQNLRFAESTVPKPIVIVLPDSVDQLVDAVLCSREESTEIRVRCGGHSYEGTSSVAVDGAPFVIIDMMNLNRISVEVETETAWVEGGATLGETYSAIADSSKNHGFSAGSCPTVGVGGHIGGGGFGLLSRKYGLAADNVVDALLIDANGRLLDREGMGEDVFWAIRGGGGGVWGIVYAWKIKLLKVPPTVTGFSVSRPGTKRHVAKLVNKWQYVAPHLEDDFYLSCFIGADLPETVSSAGMSATFKGFYLGARSKAISILNQVFPELGVVEEDCTEMSWIESIVFFSGLSNGSSVSDLKNRYLQDKRYFKAKSDYVRAPISFMGIRAALEILEKEPKGHVVLDPYGGIMQKISSKSIAFPHRKGNLFTIQYLVAWQEEDNNKSSEYIDWIRGLYHSMTPFVSWGPRAAYINYMDFDLGVMELVNTNVPSEVDSMTPFVSWGPRAAYINYMDFDLGVMDLVNTNVPSEVDAVDTARLWGEKYFLKNYDRLVRAKTQIDPNNVFNNEQGIPPMSMLRVFP